MSRSSEPLHKRVYATVVPLPVKRWIRRMRDSHEERKFGRMLARLQRDPVGAANDPELLAGLVQGWNNPWSAGSGYLARCATALAERPGSHVLECGSGLSTLVLGAVAQGTGGRVWALENHPAWRARVADAARTHGVHAATVCEAPLREYGEFDWYTVPEELRGERFQVVICDGPHFRTRGGRYGVLPVMRDQLADGCLILMDDAARESEKADVARWQREFGGTFELGGPDRQYGEFVLGARPGGAGGATRA